jgi:hypothetical protein
MNHNGAIQPAMTNSIRQQNPAGPDDDDSPEKPAARRSYLPSSMGASVLVPEEQPTPGEFR